MKRLVILVAAAVAALVAVGVAQAGCWATVGLSPLPKPGLQAGRPWFVTIRVLQHGRTPMTDAKPEVRIRTAAGTLYRFRAKLLRRSRSYRARVVFPKPGRYSIAVYDGFPYKECAHVQTFKSVVIGAAGRVPTHVRRFAEG